MIGPARTLRRPPRTGAALAALLALGLWLAAAPGCRRDAPPADGSPRPFRLGFFPNITHAQALVGKEDGTYARALGPTPLRMTSFNAGPAAMEALISGSLDATYVGTSPALIAYLKAGRELRILAGSANGGAVLVVRNARSPDDLRGKRLGVPQIGNTQDVALRTWLRAQGLREGALATGGVDVRQLSNADALGLFQRRELEGAWVPEPWGARMEEAGAHVLVDERDLWPGRQFPTTLLVTTTSALRTRKADLAALVRAHVALTTRWQEDPASFARKANEGFAAATGKRLAAGTLTAAFSRLEPALDISIEALLTSAAHAHALRYLPSEDVRGALDTSLLDAARTPARP